MKNIAIVCDSSIAFTQKEIRKYEVYVIPNIIMHNNQTYLDQVTITNKEVNEFLKRKEKVTTSQPNIGKMIEIFKNINEKGYDHIIMMTVASTLSGGYNTFNQAAKQANLENYSIIDTHSIAGPVQQAVKAIRYLNNKDKSVDEILKFVDFIFSNQVSFLFPKTLDQIVASGRVSKPAAKIASMLKIRAVVYFSQQTKSIERLAIARTDKSIFRSIIKQFEDYSINPQEYDLYFLESLAVDKVNKFKEILFDEFGKFNSYVVNLPAALSVHAGIGAIAVQWCPKIPK